MGGHPLGQVAWAAPPTTCGASPTRQEAQLEAEFTERQDGLWGVYRFKRGFGGQLVRSVGAWDRALAPLRYWVYRWLLTLRGQTRSTLQ